MSLLIVMSQWVVPLTDWSLSAGLIDLHLENIYLYIIYKNRP